MTIRWWPIPAMLLFAALFPFAAYGEDKSETFESHFDTGISPDGSTEITVLSKPGQYEEDLHLRITDVKSGRLLGDHAFDGFTFALHDKPEGVLARDAVECSWRPDGRCVALSYPMTRGFVGTTFYAPWGDQWVQLKLPEFYKQILKISRAAGENHVMVDGDAPGKGHESNVKWLPRHRFRLEAGYRAIGKMDMSFGGDWVQLFWITFRVVDARGKMKPKVLLEKVAFAPDSVYPAKP